MEAEHSELSCSSPSVRLDGLIQSTAMGHRSVCASSKKALGGSVFPFTVINVPYYSQAEQIPKELTVGPSVFVRDRVGHDHEWSSTVFSVVGIC